MQLKYKYYRGGEWNPFDKEAMEAYKKLSEERRLKDPSGTRRLDAVFPTLDSWPDYVLGASKSTFWQMERAVCRSEGDKSIEIEEMWHNAVSRGMVGEWLKKADADESEKGLCYYMASLYEKFNPNDKVVDFRLYFSEGGKGMKSEETNLNSIEIYDF